MKEKQPIYIYSIYLLLETEIARTKVKKIIIIKKSHLLWRGFGPPGTRTLLLPNISGDMAVKRRERESVNGEDLSWSIRWRRASVTWLKVDVRLMIMMRNARRRIWREFLLNFMGRKRSCWILRSDQRKEKGRRRRRKFDIMIWRGLKKEGAESQHQ